MIKKFIRGTFELERNVTDLEGFEQPKRPKLMEIIEWAKENGVAVTFGTSDDNTYLCEFDVEARTREMCKGYVSELKSMLKEIFPKTQRIIEWSGDKVC